METKKIKAQIRRFAGKYIQDNRIQVPGKTTDELIDAIYSEMAEFGFLTKYIYGEEIEEIDVNAWMMWRSSILWSDRKLKRAF